VAFINICKYVLIFILVIRTKLCVMLDIPTYKLGLDCSIGAVLSGCTFRCDNCLMKASVGIDTFVAQVKHRINC